MKKLLEPLLGHIFDMVGRLIALQLFDVPIHHKETDDDGTSTLTSVVYLHTVRQAREGFRCRYSVVAYLHRRGGSPIPGPARVFIMEYPLIKISDKGRRAEYTVPVLERPWTN